MKAAEGLERLVCTLRRIAGATQNVSSVTVSRERGQSHFRQEVQLRVSLTGLRPLHLAPSEDLGLQGPGLRLALGSGSQLLAAEGVAASAAAPLHMCDCQRTGSALRLPNPRQFPLAVRAGHGSSVRLLLTGRIVARDSRPLSSAMPSTFLAWFFAFSSVRKRFGTSRLEGPA